MYKNLKEKQLAQSFQHRIFPSICTNKKIFTMSQKHMSSVRLWTPAIDAIVSASVFNSWAFHVRKALLHSQQPKVQHKAAETNLSLTH